MFSESLGTVGMSKLQFFRGLWKAASKTHARAAERNETLGSKARTEQPQSVRDQQPAGGAQPWSERSMTGTLRADGVTKGCARGSRAPPQGFSGTVPSYRFGRARCELELLRR